MTQRKLTRFFVNRRWGRWRLAIFAVIFVLGVFDSAGAAEPSTPPPPARFEQVQPHPGFVWIDGYYQWRDDQYVWMAGHYERERRGYRWNAGRWELRGGTYVWVPGGWVAVDK